MEKEKEKQFMAGLLPLVTQAERHAGRTAIVDSEGEFTYSQLLDSSARVAAALLGPRHDLGEERVAFLVTPGFAWVAVQWGIWRAGGVAVPLPAACPAPELEYFLSDSGSAALLFDRAAEPVLAPLAKTRRVARPTDLIHSA
jgi:malonyl-CoA/methylmalonyl-CoA synthetase